MSLGTQNIDGTGHRLDLIGDAFYPLYQRLFDTDGAFVTNLERKLAQSRLPYPVEMYLSLALAAGFFSGLGLWLVGTTVGMVLFAGQEIGPLLGMPAPSPEIQMFLEVTRIPLLILSTGLFFGLTGFGIAFGAIVGYPHLLVTQRRREINMLLPDAVSFMYALSIGGMDQLEIIEAIATAEDTYGEVSREFRSILLETEYFDTDYRSAIRRQAFETPSESLNRFLTDMLSIIDSGGDMTQFLDTKKDLHFRTAKQEQERTLETLELFAEVFVTISLFPLLLIIVLIVLSLLGQGQQLLLYATVYVLIPAFGLGFTVIISTVIQDEPSEGILYPDRNEQQFEDEISRGLLDLGLVERFTGGYRIFDRIKRREGTYQTLHLLNRPDLFFRDNPIYSFALTVPAAIVLLGFTLSSGTVPTTWDGLIANPVWGTFVYFYVPLLLIGIPFSIFYEWNILSRRGILTNLSEDLRKLSSANDTGLTLLESIKTVAETSPGPFARELAIVHAKSKFGMNLKESLIVLNNKYQLPEFARTIKLINKAQEASSQISRVLTTAAQAAENRDDIERERISRTRMQVIIVIMTYLVLLGVMAVLKVRFIDVMATFGADQGTASNTGTSFGGNINPEFMSLLFFHAVVLQGVVTGLVSGYMRDARLLSGVKYVVTLTLIALVVWMVVG